MGHGHDQNNALAILILGIEYNGTGAILAPLFQTSISLVRPQKGIVDDKTRLRLG